MLSVRTSGAFAIALLGGCSLLYDAGDLQSGGRDGGVPRGDAGPPVDSGPPVDAGPRPDAGPLLDGAIGDAGPTQCPGVTGVEPLPMCTRAAAMPYTCNAKGCELCGAIAPVSNPISVISAGNALGIAVAADPVFPSTPTIAVGYVDGDTAFIRHFDADGLGIVPPAYDLNDRSTTLDTAVAIEDVDQARDVALRAISNTEVAFTLLGETTAAGPGSGVWVGSYTMAQAPDRVAMTALLGGDGPPSEARGDAVVVGGSRQCNEPLRHVWRYETAGAPLLSSVALGGARESYTEAPAPDPGTLVGTAGSLVFTRGPADAITVWDPRGSTPTLVGMLATGQPRTFAAALMASGRVGILAADGDGDGTSIDSLELECRRDGTMTACPAGCGVITGGVPLTAPGRVTHLAAEAMPYGGLAALYATDSASGGLVRLLFFTDGFTPVTHLGAAEVNIASGLDVRRLAIDVWHDASRGYVAGAVLLRDSIVVFAVRFALGC